MTKTTWMVAEAEEGERIDKLVVKRSPNWSRAKVQQWIQQGLIFVDGKPVKKGSYRLKKGEEVTIQLPPVTERMLEAESLPLDIRYEDSDLLVVNKPRGLVVHPAPGNGSGTLVNRLLAYCQGQLSDLGGEERPGIVHRIDKDTSGLLLIAKNNWIHEELAKQFKEHTVQRKYTAIVEGRIVHPSGTIKAPIGRDPIHRKRMKVDLGGKSAITHFRVKKYLAKHTWIDCSLETGRTHQIRVHMQYIGHPIVGDPLYGFKSSQKRFQGQALHAHTLRFLHPRTKEWIVVKAELPNELKQLIAKLSSLNEIEM